MATKVVRHCAVREKGKSENGFKSHKERYQHVQENEKKKKFQCGERQSSQ